MLVTHKLSGLVVHDLSSSHKAPRREVYEADRVATGETRLMRFEGAYEGWTGSRLTQGEAVRLLGVCDRTFRRYIDRYEDEGVEALMDKRLSQISHRRAPVDEAMRSVDRYRSRHRGRVPPLWHVRI